jgi:hypothetical protein
MRDTQGLLDLAVRFCEFALQTGQDDYAAQMLRTATELETQAMSQRKNRAAQVKTRVA